MVWASYKIFSVVNMLLFESRILGYKGIRVTFYFIYLMDEMIQQISSFAFDIYWSC